MDKQKRELAWLIFQEADCSLSGEDCSIIADLLINKGYRKHSTADVAEVRRGEWERIPYSFAGGYRCSCCGTKSMENYWNFCPNCGADMRGDKNDNRTEN